MSTLWLWAEAPPTRWRMRSCSQAVCSGRDSGYHTPGHSWKGLPAHTRGHQWALSAAGGSLHRMVEMLALEFS